MKDNHNYEECHKCRHWYPKKEVCRDTFPQLEKYDPITKKIVCTRFKPRYE